MQKFFECLTDAIQLLSLLISMAFPPMYRFGPTMPWHIRYPLYTVWLALYPVICVIDEFHIIAHERRDGYRRTEPVPKSIYPRWTKRRKVIAAGSQRREHVEQCGLLRLPREVRDMIWNEVLGGKTIHLQVAGGQLEGKLCGVNTADDYSSCTLLSQSSKSVGQGLMGIVMSCTQIYAETAQLIYSLNNFQTSSAQLIAYLPRVLLSKSSNSITSLDFTWLIIAPPSFPHPMRCSWSDRGGKFKVAKSKNHYLREIWLAVWKNLAAMEGLFYLRVELDTKAGSVSNALLWETTELEIVKSVTKPRKFQLALHEEFASRARKEIMATNLDIIVQLPKQLQF